MNERSAPRPVGHYEVRVEGHLGERWSSWFDGFTLTRGDDGTTTLRGPVKDQAELHGLLGKVRDLGATLLSVMAVDAEATDPEPGQLRAAATLSSCGESYLGTDIPSPEGTSPCVR